MVRMAKKTMELTIQVALKSRAMCTTALVSSSMNPAPRKNIWPLGRARRTGANRKRIASDINATIAIPRRFRAGINGRRR